MARSAAARVIPAARSAAGASTGAPVSRGAVVFPRVTAVVPVLRVCVAKCAEVGVWLACFKYGSSPGASVRSIWLPVLLWTRVLQKQLGYP